MQSYLIKDTTKEEVMELVALIDTILREVTHLNEVKKVLFY